MQEAAAAEEEGSFELVATRPAAAGGTQLAAKPSRPTEYEASGDWCFPACCLLPFFAGLLWLNACSAQQALEGLHAGKGSKE